MNYAVYALPILFVLLFLYCLIKRVPAYDHFIKGCSTSIELIISIFPFLIAILIFIELMNVSGISLFLAQTLAPIFRFLGIPTELAGLIILRPFSGNGSLAIVREIFALYGPDSYIGRCAAVVVGASDTVFYVVAIYFSTTKVKRLLYAVPVCLISSIAGSIISCLFCRLF